MKLKRPKAEKQKRGKSNQKSNQELKQKFRPKIILSSEVKILFVTIFIAAVLIILGVISSNFGILANLILLSTFIVAVPQFLVMYEKYRDVREMQEKFPAFLRDVIESMTAGVSLHQAIINNSKFDYGKLSKEVKKMANQLTWGLPLTKVLTQLANRVKSSKRLYASVKIINESYISGGDVISILSTLTDHSNILEEAEKERKSLLNQYVVLMYAISIIFIVIVVAINRLMVPIFEATSIGAEAGEAIGMTNPCDPDLCNGFDCAVCELYTITSVNVFSIDPTSIGAYYISVFFFMSIIQAVFSGLVAGQIGENSVKAGVKHSLILISITLGTFYFLIYFKILTA